MPVLKYTQQLIKIIVYAPTKGEWYRNLRHRAFQCLEYLSDEEIEEGLQELDQTDFAGMNEEDKIVAIDPVAVIVARK